MIVQWYDDIKIENRMARIFLEESEIADLHCVSLAETEISLNLLGWRRNEKWQKTEWGYEAKIRRIK